MPAAIDRVLRNLSSKAVSLLARERIADLSEDEAVSMATRMLENYKTQSRTQATRH
jgi:hypothetical protein